MKSTCDISWFRSLNKYHSCEGQGSWKVGMNLLFLKTRKSKIQGPADSISGKVLPLGFQMAASLLTWPRGNKISSILSYQGTNHFIAAPPLWSHVKFSKVPFPNSFTLEARTSIYDSEEGIQFSLWFMERSQHSNLSVISKCFCCWRETSRFFSFYPSLVRSGLPFRFSLNAVSIMVFNTLGTLWINTWAYFKKESLRIGLGYCFP